ERVGDDGAGQRAGGDEGPVGRGEGGGGHRNARSLLIGSVRAPSEPNGPCAFVAPTFVLAPSAPAPRPFAAPLQSRAVFMVGLTGGIGSGKSTVAELLRARGAIVIDADLIARQVVEPGTEALAALTERFGADILRPDGHLDRAALAKKAF